MEALRRAGWKLQAIAIHMGRSYNAVRQCVVRIANNSQIVRPGRESVITDRDRRRVLRAVSNKCTTSAKVKHELNLPFSARTVRRIIQRSDHVTWKKKSRKPLLNGAHKAARVAWCQARLNWVNRWKKIVFSDEKKFNLDGPDGNTHYYHDDRKAKLIYNTRHTGGGSVMIWAAIGWRGKSEICFLEGKQNAARYQQTLHDTLLPCGGRIGGGNWIFMQDNASIHRAHTTRAWLEDHDVRVLPWPAKSPDLNPIENVWAVLAQHVYAEGRQYTTKEELKQAILVNWPKISGEYRRTLYNSLPTRVLDVVNSNGNSIDY